MGTHECLFELLRYGLGKSNECKIPEGVNWSEVYNLPQFGIRNSA